MSQLSLIGEPEQGSAARQTARGQGPVLAPAADWGLRPYQCEAFDSVVDGWADNHRTQLVVMATGLGKTQLFCALAGREVDTGGRVLIVAHRTELIEQAAHRARDMVGCLVGVEQAGRYASNERIVVGSVQTLGPSEVRRQAFASSGAPTLIIIDEAHHAIAETYRAILETWPQSRVVGVTATPDRGDGLAMGQIFERVAYVRDIETGILDGYLAPIVSKQFVLEEVDLSHVETTNGDLNLGQLDEEMLKANLAITHKCLELCRDRLTIVFSTKVETAHDLARLFNHHSGGKAVAQAIDAKTPPEDRKRILGSHRRREFQFLINVGIATEGYDCPEVSCVVVARPTKSRALYTQMGGRGLRPLARVLKGLDSASQADRREAIEWSEKPDCLILDFTGNSGRHDLACPLDLILDGRELTDRERKVLKDKMRTEQGARVSSKSDVKALIEAERAARAAEHAKYDGQVKGRLIDRSPFRRATDEDAAAEMYVGDNPITAAQRALLEQFGVHRSKIPSGKAEAGKLIGYLKERRARGLCTWRQTQVLTAHGISNKSVTVRQASQIIDYMKQNARGSRWATPPLDFLDSVVGPREAGQEG